MYNFIHAHTHTPHTQHACGYEYTSRLQRMLVDIKLSAEGNTGFTDHLQAEGLPLSISFSTLILQSAAWPLSSATCPLTLPQELLPYLKQVGTCFINTSLYRSFFCKLVGVVLSQFFFHMLHL